MDFMQPIIDFLKGIFEKMKMVADYLLEQFLPGKSDDETKKDFWVFF